MIERELKDITEEVLLSLVANGATEGKTLEFKRSLDIDTSDARLKFLRGIAAFSNASGGDMVFGIVAKDGKAESIMPLPNFNPDKDALRIRDVIRMNIEPRSVFAELHPVQLSTGGYALVIRIRKSWAGAHFVTHNGDFRFFTRDHGGKRLMEVPEIRNAFTLSESIRDRIARFRLERTANILADETPESLFSNRRIVLHICPLSSFESGKLCDLSALQRQTTKLKPLNAHGTSYRHDFEGFYTFQNWGAEEVATGYTLVSRAGWIEAVESYWLRPDRDTLRNGLTDILPTRSYEEEMPEALAAYFEVLKIIGAEPPDVVMLSFLNVRGFTIYQSPRYRPMSVRRINRDHLMIPSELVDTLEIVATDRTKPNAVDILRPMFDAVWNACGLMRSRHFDAQGNWNPPQD